MPITGSQLAPLYAILDTTVPQGARIGATRLDYYVPRILIDLNGTRVNALATKSAVRLDLNLDETPDTATLVVRGGSITPAVGQSIVIGLGTTANRLFAGRVIRCHLQPFRASQRYPRYELECVDASWELDHHRSTGRRWIATSASTIAADLLTAVASTFSQAIETNLLSVDFEVAPNETISSALSRLAKVVGAYWYVDPLRTVRLYTTTNQTTSEINHTRLDFWGLDYDEDLSQIRNRVIVIGGGPVTTQDAAVSATTVYVEDVAVWFASAGGTATLGPQTITYTGYVDDATPRLTGVTGVLYAMPSGTPCRVLVTRNNTTAQTALATLLGVGDGIVAHTIEDETLDVDGATFVGDGELAKFQSTLKTVTVQTRDKFMLPGRKAVLSLTTPATMSATLFVQQVTISGIIAERAWPRRSATMSTWKRNLSDLLSTLVAS